MKGFRFLREGEQIREGDEFRWPWRDKKWEAVGAHMIGEMYERRRHFLTFRRKATPN